jgi:HD-like signal output (HDOD) protein
MRVLFVDDETRVLEAIERVLVELESDWETKFVSSGDLGLQALAQQQYDVIISDLRMPGVDGVELLNRAAQLYPRSVRLVLSGHSDEEASLKLVHVAHQFLAKPCSADTLYQVVERIRQLAELLPDRKLQTLIGQIGMLPCATELEQELLALVESDDVDADRIAAVVRRDPALTSKLLQVASSAFFNSSASVNDVEAAIMRLGLRTLKDLTRRLCKQAPARASASPTVSAVTTLQHRAHAIARLSAAMVRLPEDASAAYVAGLLCDIGQLVLINSAPERQYVTQAEASQRGVPQHLAEQATWGTTHAEIGAYLLGLWGLPVQIVNAVAEHHAPEREGADRLGLGQLVWLASCIVDDEEPPPELLSRFGAEELYYQHRHRSEETDA